MVIAQLPSTRGSAYLAHRFWPNRCGGGRRRCTAPIQQESAWMTDAATKGADAQVRRLQGGEGGKNCAGNLEPKCAAGECYTQVSRQTNILGDIRPHPPMRAVPSSPNPAVELPGAQGSPGALGSSQGPPLDHTCPCMSGAAAEVG